MAIKYKVKCSRCKTNYITVTYKTKYPVCYECVKKDLVGEIEDKDMKKLFNVPEEFYMKNAFLRDIKIKYLRYKNLSDKQIEAFKKTVEKLKEPKG